MSLAKKIFSYLLSAIFFLLFGILLLLFDPIQRVCLNLLGYNIHRISVAIFNGLTLRALHILGTTYDIKLPDKLPVNKPVIIVSNHQSMWDIPPLIWFLKSLHPKFISKKELGHGIPTISYNLKHGGSVLIDRKNTSQAIQEIKKMAHYISKHNRAVVIFPEGTRSRTGELKPFKQIGLLTLIEHAPEAYVLPVSIKNSWKLQQFGLFPIPLAVKLHFTFHHPIKVSDYSPQEILSKVETQIKNTLTA